MDKFKYNKEKKERNLIFSEIVDQQKAWKNSIDKLSNIDKKLLDVLKEHKNFYFIGCGSSYHTGLIIQFIYDLLFKKKSICADSSDFLFYPKKYTISNSSRNVFFLISRTGETTETLLIMDVIKKNKGATVALTSIPDSKLARECDFSVAFMDSQEKSITATKSMTSITIFLLNLIFTLSGLTIINEKISSSIDKYFKDFGKYFNMIQNIINETNFKKVIFLGSGPFFGVAKEAELKVKEMSITNTESSHPLEFRHGHKSILDKKTLVVLFLSEAGFKYELNSAREFKKICSKVLIICDNKRVKEQKYAYDYLIDIDLCIDELARPIFYILFGQLLGYHQAIRKGINPSFPRNLDFVVTF